MEFSNSSLSWTLGNALLSSGLDFFILDYELKPIYYTDRASDYLPSFLQKNEGSKLIFVSETEKEQSFISYLKTHLNKNEIDSIEQKLKDSNQKQLLIRLAQEKLEDTLNLVVGRDFKVYIFIQMKMHF